MAMIKDDLKTLFPAKPVLVEKFEAFWCRSYCDHTSVGLILNPYMYKMVLKQFDGFEDFEIEATWEYIHLMCEEANQAVYTPVIWSSIRSTYEEHVLNCIFQNKDESLSFWPLVKSKNAHLKLIKVFERIATSTPTSASMNVYILFTLYCYPN